MKITRYVPEADLYYDYSTDRICDALDYGSLWADCEMKEDENGEYVKLEDAIAWSMYWKLRHDKISKRKK